MLTISEEVQKRLQEKSYKIVEAIQVIGGTNVQWAHNPVTDRDYDQMTLKEYIDPFTGEPVIANK